MYGVELLKNWIDIGGTIITSAAVLIGAWWFFVRRANIRKANISHKVSFVPVGDDFYLNVQVNIKNTGNRQIFIDGTQGQKGAEWTNVVLVEEVSPFLESNATEGLPETAEFSLLPIDAKAFPGKLVIEPSEEQAIVFDFIVPKTSRVVRIYSRIPNSYNDGSGWSKVTIHKVQESI